jgi:hypothetical protein
MGSAMQRRRTKDEGRRTKDEWIASFGGCLDKGTREEITSITPSVGGTMNWLWAIAALLVLLWIGGLVLDVVGNLIHILLVLALLAILIPLFKSFARRAT